VLPVTSLVVGWPAEAPSQRDRLPAACWIHDERYQRPSGEDIDRDFAERERRGRAPPPLEEEGEPDGCDQREPGGAREERQNRQRATGRVVYLVRQSPGETDETIRIRREIKEGDYAYATLFRPFVEVPFADGSSKIFQLAVASRQTPYALVNERVRVAFYPQDDVAYGIRHHRTWAFGCGFVMVGSTLVIISCFLLRMVGKKNYIDPEDPAQLELERQATALEQALHSEKAPTPEDMEPNPPPFAD
jgi:hypothetical protein